MAPLPCVVITFPSSSRMISVGMPGRKAGWRMGERERRKMNSGKGEGGKEREREKGRRRKGKRRQRRSCQFWTHLSTTYKIYWPPYSNVNHTLSSLPSYIPDTSKSRARVFFRGSSNGMASHGISPKYSIMETSSLSELTKMISKFSVASFSLL